jgi:phage shock protein A
MEDVMRLIKRVSGIVTANLNDLIDQCENPEKMLKQAVREMETALGQLMDGAARAIAHHKLLVRQLGEQRAAIERRMKSAEAAVARGDDEVARRELRQRAEHQRLAEGLARQVETADVLGQRLRGQVTAMRMRLAEARRKLVDISARNRAAKAQRKFVNQLPGEIGVGTAWSNFDNLCSRVEQSEAETEALLELLGESEMNEVFDAEVEAELRSLQEKVGHVVT